MSEDRFKNIEVTLKGGAQNNLKAKNIYNRARTAQENLKSQISDQALKKDSKTIDIDSIGSTHNLNVDLIQDQKLILTHLQKQNNNSSQQQNERSSSQAPPNSRQDCDGANITFYPRQSPLKKKTASSALDYDSKEAYQSTQQPKEIRKRNITECDEKEYSQVANKKNFTEQSQYGRNQTGESQNAAIEQRDQEEVDSGQNRSNTDKVQLTNILQQQQQQQQILNQRQQQLQLIQKQQQQQQQQQQQLNQQQNQQQQQQKINIQKDFQFNLSQLENILTQPETASLNSQANINNKKIFSEGQQPEQLEQIPKNQMKFHNLYQKNITHQKNNSLPQGIQSIGITMQDKNKLNVGINYLEFQYSSALNSQNESKQQQLLRGQQYQVNQQQRALNQATSIKRQLLQTTSKGNSSMMHQVPSVHHQRSNSHHIETVSNNYKNSSIVLANQFDPSLKEYMQNDLLSIKGRERCNFSVDQILNSDISSKYYSDNKFRNMNIASQQDNNNNINNMTTYKKNNRNGIVDILGNNIMVNNNFPSTNSNSDNNKKVIALQSTSVAQKDVQQNHHLSQLQQTFSTAIAGNNVVGSGSNNSGKKLSDICLPSLDQQIKPKNQVICVSEPKKITLNQLKLSTSQQNQALQLGIDKFTFNSAAKKSTAIKGNSKVPQNTNTLALESKTGVFGAVVMNNNNNENRQQSDFIINNPKDSSAIIKKNIVETIKQQQPQAGPQVNNNDNQSNQELLSDQMLEETGRFGPEQSCELQSQQHREIIIRVPDKKLSLKQQQLQELNNQNNNNIALHPSINKNNSNRNSLNGVMFDQQILNPIALRKASQSTHYSTDKNEEQSSINVNLMNKSVNNTSNKIHQMSSHVVGSVPMYSNSGVLMTDGSELMSNANTNQIINIPVITTNLGLNNNQQNNDSINQNQGTLLIHYNFPLAENFQYRSKYYQHQQKQQFAAQSSNLNNTQKKVSSAISCKRKDDFYSQFGFAANDLLDKQQRARSSNNRFPREIFTPNVQKAKRLYNQNRQNVNPNTSSDQQNEFIS